MSLCKILFYTYPVLRGTASLCLSDLIQKSVRLLRSEFSYNLPVPERRAAMYREKSVRALAQSLWNYFSEQVKLGSVTLNTHLS